MVSIITAAAIAAGIPPALLLSVCFVESGHRNVVTHHDGGSASIGICQMKYQTARMVRPNVQPSDLFSPKTNAETAARYLAYQYRRYHGRWDCAVAAYNRGSVRCVEGVSNAYTRKVKQALRSMPWIGSEIQ